MNKLKIVGILIAVSLILSLLLVIVGKREKTYPVRIEMASEIDLGELFRNDTVMFEVSCKNIGKSVAEIENISTQCGCLHWSFTTTVINPNDSAAIKFTYIPGSVGYSEQNVFLYFKNNDNPFHLLIKCRIKK